MRTVEYEVCAEAQKALEYGLHDVASKVAQVIEKNAWREFVTPTGRTVRNRTFVEFVTKKQPDGLGTDIDTIRRVCKDTPWALDLVDQALQRPPGRPAETVDNIHSSRPDGTSAEAALRRLRKDRPDLHERVMQGELTPHGAMVEAGFRSRRFSIPGNPSRAAEAIRKHFTLEDIQELIDALQR